MTGTKILGRHVLSKMLSKGRTSMAAGDVPKVLAPKLETGWLLWEQHCRKAKADAFAMKGLERFSHHFIREKARDEET